MRKKTLKSNHNPSKTTLTKVVSLNHLRVTILFKYLISMKFKSLTLVV